MLFIQILGWLFLFFIVNTLIGSAVGMFLIRTRAYSDNKEKPVIDKVVRQEIFEGVAQGLLVLFATNIWPLALAAAYFMTERLQTKPEATEQSET